jgi:hypothetical protein
MESQTIKHDTYFHKVKEQIYDWFDNDSFILNIEFIRKYKIILFKNNIGLESKPLITILKYNKPINLNISIPKNKEDLKKSSACSKKLNKNYSKSREVTKEDVMVVYIKLLEKAYSKKCVYMYKIKDLLHYTNTK